MNIQQATEELKAAFQAGGLGADLLVHQEHTTPGAAWGMVCIAEEGKWEACKAIVRETTAATMAAEHVLIAPFLPCKWRLGASPNLGPNGFYFRFVAEGAAVAVPPAEVAQPNK